MKRYFSDDRAQLIHDMKTRLTAISGYAQLLERQAQDVRHTSPKQIEYLTRLRRSIDDLAEDLFEREHRLNSDQPRLQGQPGRTIAPDARAARMNGRREHSEIAHAQPV